MADRTRSEAVLVAVTLVLIALGILVIPGPSEATRWVVGVACLLAAILVLLFAPKRHVPADEPPPPPPPPPQPPRPKGPLLVWAQDSKDITIENSTVVGGDLIHAQRSEDIKIRNSEALPKPDGPVLPRSAPCWCGSGKKYKRCHGKRKE